MGNFFCRIPAPVFQIGHVDCAEPEKPLPHEHDGGAAQARGEPHGGGKHPLPLHQAVRRVPVLHQRDPITV